MAKKKATAAAEAATPTEDPRTQGAAGATAAPPAEAEPQGPALPDVPIEESGLPPVVGFNPAPDVLAEDEAIPVYRYPDETDAEGQPAASRPRRGRDSRQPSAVSDQPDEEETQAEPELDTEEEPIGEEPGEPEETEEEEETEFAGEAGEQAAGGSGELTDRQIADYWYSRAQEQDRRLRELEQRLATAAGAAPSPAAPVGAPAAGPPASTAGGPMPGTPSPRPAPPTLDEIAQELGTYPDDPTVKAVHQQALRAHTLEQRLDQLQQALAPIERQRREAEFEGLMQRAFAEWASDPQQVPPDHVAQLRECYPYLAEYIRRGEAKTFQRALDLYTADYHRMTAPQREREAGRREGFTEAARRNTTNRLANAVAGTRATRQTTGPRMMDIDAAIESALAERGR